MRGNPVPGHVEEAFLDALDRGDAQETLRLARQIFPRQPRSTAAASPNLSKLHRDPASGRPVIA